MECDSFWCKCLLQKTPPDWLIIFNSHPRSTVHTCVKSFADRIGYGFMLLSENSSNISKGHQVQTYSSIGVNQRLLFWFFEVDICLQKGSNNILGHKKLGLGPSISQKSGFRAFLWISARALFRHISCLKS